MESKAGVAVASWRGIKCHNTLMRAAVAGAHRIG